MATASWMNDLNANYLHSVGPDGQYNRDRLLKQIGVDPSKTTSLSGAQQKQMKALIEQDLGQPLEGATIDTAGNINEPEGFKHYAKKYGPIAGGVALTMFGIPGFMPGLLGGIGTGGATAAGSAATGAAGSGAGGSMGWLGSLGKFAAQNVGDIVGGIGSGMKGASQAQASNRGTQFEGQSDLMQLLMDRDKQYQDMAISREKEGRAGTSDAYRKLMAAQRLLNPAAQPNVSPYAAAARVPTDVERQGATALSDEVMKRLTGGNPITPVAPRAITGNDAAFRINPGLLQAGKGESLLGWLGSGLGAYGSLSALNDQRKRTTTPPPPATPPYVDDLLV